MLGLNRGRARRRLSLLAGGSLAAASLLGAAGGLLLAPASALAANECGDPNANGATADVFACTGTLPSIAYPSTNGNLTLTLTNGPTVTTGGISVTGSGANTVLINRSDATAGGGDPSIANTAGAGIQATTGTGALTLTLTDGDVTGGDTPLSITGTTYGVQLQSGATTGAALALTTTNGSITATAANGVGVDATITSLAAGNANLNLGGAVTGAIGVRGVSNGTGNLSVTATAVSATVLGGDIVGTNGPAIRLTPAANGFVTVGSGRTVRASNSGGGVIEFTNVNATRGVTVTNNAEATIRSNADGEAAYDDVIVLVAGGAGSSTIRNNSTASTSGLLLGRVALLNTGAVTVENSGNWHTTGLNTFGQGAGSATLTIGIQGMLATNAGGEGTTFAFGDGTDTFVNSGGLLRVGEGLEAANTLTLTGLETWTNSGRVIFGGNNDIEGEVSDGVGNDRIVASSTVFNGVTSGNNSGFRTSTLIMDADLGVSQADCSAAVTADCLDLRGGATTGSTAVVVNVTGIGPGAERIVLVDVSGAGAGGGAGQFTFDANTPGLIDLGGTGGVLDGGFLLYGLSYDAAAKQHVLAPQMLSSEGVELGLAGRAAKVAWETTTGNWFTRQADLRDSLAQGDARFGGWLKVAGNFVEDTVYQSYPFGPDMLDIDSSYAQRTSAVVGGIDLLGGAGDGGGWVVGVTAAQVTSEMEFHEEPTRLEFDGYSYGAYASLIGSSFFLDAIVNAVKMDAEYSAATAAITGVTGDLDSLGYQVEGGWRLAFGEGAYVEPLAALSYVKSDLGDLAFANVEVTFDEMKSFRGALGVRVAGALVLDAFTTQASITGRVWQEFEGENTAAVSIPGATFQLMDDTADALGDLSAALGLFAGQRFSASLNYGVRFKEDYLSTDVSLSFRARW